MICRNSPTVAGAASEWFINRGSQERTGFPFHPGGMNTQGHLKQRRQK